MVMLVRSHTLHVLVYVFTRANPSTAVVSALILASHVERRRTVGLASPSHLPPPPPPEPPPPPSEPPEPLEPPEPPELPVLPVLPCWALAFALVAVADWALHVLTSSRLRID
jgi:hypothetical protein